MSNYGDLERRGTNVNEEKLNELRSKAFIPDKIPDDFLRIHLNPKQISETQDVMLAQRLQYGNNRMPRNQMWRVPPRGRLQLTFFEARLAKNYGFTRMDPYVRLTIDDKIFETHTDNNGGKNPKWNKVIVCYLPNNVDSFVIEIFDEKAFSEDEQIAVLHYTFPDELFQGAVIDEWFPLSGRLGEQKEGNIHLRLQFAPLDVSQINQPITNTNRQSRQPNVNIYEPASAVVRLPSDEISTEQNIPLIAAEDVKALKEMFPTFDEDIIRSILETNNGHKENTINMLLQMTTD